MIDTSNIKFDSDMAKRMAKEGIKAVKQLPSTYVRPDALRGIGKGANAIRGLALGLALEGMRASSPFVSDEERARRINNTTGMKIAKTGVKLAKGAGNMLFNGGQRTQSNTMPPQPGTEPTQSNASTERTKNPAFEEINIDVPDIPIPSLGKGNVDSIAKYIQANQSTNDYVGLPNIPNPQIQNVQGEATSMPSNNSYDIGKIIDIYNKQLEAQQPYREALAKFMENYPSLMRDAERRQRYYTALSGLSGNKGYANIGNTYNPLSVEQQRLALAKELANINAGNVSGLNELQGNVAIAKQLGLPEESAFADKNLLNTLSGIRKAELGLAGRQYSSDSSLQGKIYDTQLDNATKVAIANGNMKLAQQLQSIKNDNNLQRSLLQAMGMAQDPTSLIDVYNSLSGKALGLNTQGLANGEVNFSR